MWRARNPDSPRIVAAQNELSAPRFVPFASNRDLLPEPRAAAEGDTRTRASLPLAEHPPAARYADLEARGLAEMPVVQEGPVRAAGAHDQADRGARDHAL